MVTMEGLAELRDLLRTLPTDLATDANGIVQARGRAAYDEIEAAYPEGGLRDGLTFSDESAQFAARAVIRSRAPHAYLYEYGTQTIRYTHAGVSRGQMPAAGTVVKAAIHNRAAMYDELIAMLRAHGFDVSAAEAA
jgi:hypothetical protein